MPDPPTPLPLPLSEALRRVRAPFGQTIDLIVRRLSITGSTDAAVLYFEGMADRVALEQHVLAPLLKPPPFGAAADPLALARSVLTLREVTRVSEIEKAVEGLLNGQAVLLCDGAGAALVLDVTAVPSRPVGEAKTEPVVRGPRQAFVEDLGVNLAMLRRIVSDARLRYESFRLGTVTHTVAVVAYLEGTADRRVLARVRRRLKGLRTVSVLGSRPVEEMLGGGHWTPFPLLDSTERPERVAAGLMEGRVGIIIDGTPDILLAPVTFWHLLQSPEDYHTVSEFATFVRVMRLLGCIAVLALPSFYVALTSYHLELLPTVLALSMNAAHAQVPFPGLVEALLLELIFEAVREAGVRLPKPAGQAVTIVGGLIIGQAAIGARLVSPMMVIVVAATGVASFTIPNYQLSVSLRVLRFPLMFMSGVLGLFGYMLTLLAVLLYACALRSFGRPFLSPLAPLQPKARDVVWRPPHQPRGRGRRRRPGQP